LTAQNTLGVRNVHVVPAEFVGEQIDACVEDVGVDVVKTGTLPLLLLLCFNDSGSAIFSS
jgi:hydroxymethylpyrimidine/phosphomethylpyrimidine kinase